MAVTKELLKRRFEKQIAAEQERNRLLGAFDESEITRLAVAGLAAIDLYKEVKLRVQNIRDADPGLYDAVAKFEAEVKAL